jgi:uncharacterized membrane protein YbhN (UPF0104 family)
MSKATNRSVRPLVVKGLLVAIAVGLLGWVIWKNWVPLRAVFARNLDPRLIGLAMAIYMAGLLLTFVRWFLLVRVIEPNFRLRDAFQLGFIGNVYNLLIPGAVGGDLIKAVFLTRMRINSTQAIASMVLDRVVGLLGLFVLAGVAGGLAWPVAPTVVRRLIVVAWALLGTGFVGLALVFSQALTRRFPVLLSGHGRLALIVRELRALSETYRQHLGVVVGTLGMSIVNHSCNVLAFYTISRTIFPNGLPTLAQHFLLVPLTLFTIAVPIPFGAAGFTEQVSDQLFKLVAHPGGALAMMGFRVLMYAGALISVGFYLAKRQEVRSLTHDVEHLEETLLEEEPAPL